MSTAVVATISALVLVLRQYAKQKTTDLFPEDGANVDLLNSSTYELLQRLEDILLGLKPANSRDQWWLGQATTLATRIGDTRLVIRSWSTARIGTDEPLLYNQSTFISSLATRKWSESI